MTIKFLSDRGYLKTSKQVASNIKEKKEQIVDRGEILRDQYNEEWRKFAKRMKEKSDQHRRKQTKNYKYTKFILENHHIFDFFLLRAWTANTYADFIFYSIFETLFPSNPEHAYVLVVCATGFTPYDY